ncbi:ribose phosphate diphosphokinase subunit prs4 [Stygiomarasmius scandens]|uniref:Ribose phosphate diphosphokinase subunit prs4 n=1 Tax=Marasmiellus scandens TaxID=2682957 RepID=A0ABR1K413_9AGAR
MLVAPSGEGVPNRFFEVPILSGATAVAEKLGVDFALINRKQDGRKEDAPEKMEILVGNVKDKLRNWISLLEARIQYLAYSDLVGRPTTQFRGVPFDELFRPLE